MDQYNIDLVKKALVLLKNDTKDENIFNLKINEIKIDLRW